MIIINENWKNIEQLNGETTEEQREKVHRESLSIAFVEELQEVVEAMLDGIMDGLEFERVRSTSGEMGRAILKKARRDAGMTQKEVE